MKILKLKAPFFAFTPKTITDPDQLLSEVEASIEAGVALGSDEFREGVSGISAPVLGADGRVHAMIGCSLPTTRLNPKFITMAKDVIRRQASEFSTELGYRPPKALRISAAPKKRVAAKVAIE